MKIGGFARLTLKRKQHDSQENAGQGILPESSPFIGKSRLIAESLKHHLAETFLSIPDVTKPIPELHHEAVRYLTKRSVDIFLDDLERQIKLA